VQLSTIITVQMHEGGFMKEILIIDLIKFYDAQGVAMRYKKVKR
jgi:hypothetical protein